MSDPTAQAGPNPPVADPTMGSPGRHAGNGTGTLDPHTIGTGAPAPDAQPVGADDRAVIAVFPDLDSAEQAVVQLVEKGFPADRVSIIGQDMHSEIRINGFVTASDVAGPAAARGAWVGGLFGLLTGAALLFIPGAGPLVVLGPLAGAAVGAAEGALIGGAVGTILGHFVERHHLPKYEELVRAGSYLVVVHGGENDVERAQRLLTDMGSTDVQRHDRHRGSIDRIGPIDKVFEGMKVLDVNGDEVGKVEFVKLGDPQAVTTAGEDPSLMPRLPSPFARRLLRIGYVKIDRKGLFAKDAYADATQIERVSGNLVHLNVPKEMLLPEM